MQPFHLWVQLHRNHTLVLGHSENLCCQNWDESLAILDLFFLILCVWFLVGSTMPLLLTERKRLMSVEKRVHYNFPLFSHFLKSLNLFKFCHFWANLNCECTHMHIHTVVNNCLTYCPGCILQNHLRSGPAWADSFYGPPNEIWVSFSSDAIRWNAFFPRELWSFFIYCSGIFLLMELPSLQIANGGECSSLPPLQHALAKRLPPGPAWQCQCCLLLLCHTPGFFFPRGFFYPHSMSLSLLCERRQLAWSHVGNH